jgi:hypothetical protein
MCPGRLCTPASPNPTEPLQEQPTPAANVEGYRMISVAEDANTSRSSSSSSRMPKPAGIYHSSKIGGGAAAHETNLKLTATMQ